MHCAYHLSQAKLPSPATHLPPNFCSPSAYILLTFWPPSPHLQTAPSAPTAHLLPTPSAPSAHLLPTFCPPSAHLLCIFCSPPARLLPLVGSAAGGGARHEAAHPSHDSAGCWGKVGACSDQGTLHCGAFSYASSVLVRATERASSTSLGQLNSGAR